MSIGQRAARAILKLSGWNMDVEFPDEKKFIIIGAPHTSNWDLPLGLLCIWAHGQKLSWFAKKQIFTGPLYYFFTALGGIPVDRSAPHGLTEQVADMFRQRDELIIGITPEGTRSKTEYWKTGFYTIAQNANVPICFGYVDFPSRTVGFVRGISPSGNIQKDFETIAGFYADKRGRFPQMQGPVRAKPR